MLRNMNTDYLNWIVLIGILLLLLEVVFFNGGLIIAVVLSTGCIYLGSRWKPGFMGKMLYWIGWIWLIVTVLNMITFRYFFCVVLVSIVVQFFQSQKKPKEIKPATLENVSKPGEFHKQGSLFKNKLFANQTTPEHVYEWNDINIQVGVGNTIIDLSDTVLPNGEAVISIRSLIGNIQILVPYEVEIQLNHSIIVGSVTIFQEKEHRIVNETVVYKSGEYDQAEQKVKIITAGLTGKLEVKRV